MVNFKENYHFSGGPTFSRGVQLFQGGGGSNCLFPIETHITCDFPGGGGGVRTPCPPLWIRTWRESKRWRSAGKREWGKLHNRPGYVIICLNARNKLHNRRGLRDHLLKCTEKVTEQVDLQDQRSKCSEHTTEQVYLQDQRLKCSEHTTEHIDLHDQMLICSELTTEQVFL